MPPRASERGAALLLAIMAMLCMAAVGAVLMLTTSTEMLIAGGFDTSEAARYAAEAAAERALADLALPGDWGAFVDGSARSTFVDGSPGGTRTLPDGSPLNIDAEVNLANCQSAAACTVAEMNAVTADRPWGPNNPRWTPFAYGLLAALAPAAALTSPFYLLVLVGDDPLETDGDPLRDGTSADNPGAGVLSIRALAFGPRGVTRGIELVVARPLGDGESGSYNERARDTGVQVLSWREVR